jgi:hypothetical protein
MAQLIYSAVMSLDGYVADKDGKFGWAEPDEEVHAFFNDLARPARHPPLRTADVRDDEGLGDRPLAGRPVAPYAGLRDIWQAADKVVYSTRWTRYPPPGRGLARAFDPEAVRQMKASAERDLSVGGPDLAAHAFRPGWSTRATWSSRP